MCSFYFTSLMFVLTGNNLDCQFVIAESFSWSLDLLNTLIISDLSSNYDMLDCFKNVILLLLLLLLWPQAFIVNLIWMVAAWKNPVQRTVINAKMELSVLIEIHQSASAHLDFMVLCASLVIVLPILVETVEPALLKVIDFVVNVHLHTKETSAKSS